MSPIIFKTETILDIWASPLFSLHAHFFPPPLLTENLSEGPLRNAHYVLYGGGGGWEGERRERERERNLIVTIKST